MKETEVGDAAQVQSEKIKVFEEKEQPQIHHSVDCEDAFALIPVLVHKITGGIVHGDGNDHQQLIQAVASHEKDKPRVLVANTVKGKGVSFMENEIIWHYRDPQGECYERAIQELGGDPSCETI